MNAFVSQSKIDFYRENGFVQIENVMSPDELEELRQYMDEVMNSDPQASLQTDQKGGGYFRVLNQRVNTWRDHAGMAKYSLHSRFAEIALALTGENAVRLFHDHALLKMPGDSKPTAWHQDLTYWPIEGNGALSIWIALDDVDENNGCMMFVPKSRNVGKLTSIDLNHPEDLMEFAKGTEVESTKPVTVRMKAGSCTFHDALTFHYAFANITDKPRRAHSIIYIPDGTIYTGRSNIVLDDTGQTAGQPIGGNLYPILARRAAKA